MAERDLLQKPESVFSNAAFTFARSFLHLVALFAGGCLVLLLAAMIFSGAAARMTHRRISGALLPWSQACRYLVIDFGTSKSPYMVSSRFARLNNPNDRDKIASIYP
ncbi:hypothetical protein, partial [Thiolapillus sp.]|uniref:hypothetical protein n=1 Tax=Thiolapillus sp. TaxID=2017437 RepID=UPI003AF4794C